MEHLIYILPLFCITALVYSSVGFGGGSTYLALLVLFGLPYESIPKIALICNLIVVTGGLYHYIKAGSFCLRRFFPFVATSIPFAYLGGSLPISKTFFLVILGLSLAMAGLRLLFTKNTERAPRKTNRFLTWTIGLGIGSILGFISGLVGIGGGIFLAPILYFIRWGNARQIAAMASFFIFVNSLFGLFGQFSKPVGAYGPTGTVPLYGAPLLEWIFPLALAVFIGGQIGSRLSVGRIPLVGLQRITAALILFVSGRIFFNLF